jgi:hypothetical protein
MVHYFKTKTSKEKKYVVVIDKPTFTEVELNGSLVGVRNQSIKYGVITDDLVIIEQNYNINDIIEGYEFSNQLVDGYDNLFQLIKK